MANNNVQKITFAFEADTNKAKQSINDLFRTLEKVASEQRVGDLGFDQDLAKASDAAFKLGQHLKNAVNVNTGKLDLSRLNQSLKKSGDNFKQLKQDLWAIDGVGVEAFNQIEEAISNAEPATIRINKHLSNFLTSLKNTVKWQLTSNITHGLESSLSKAYNYAKDLNQSLNNIRIVTGQSSKEMANFAKQANKAAQSLSTSTLNYTDAALIYYQQGLTGQEVTERTDTTIKLANVTGQSAEEVSSYMTAVWNNFDDGSKKLEYFADVITALGASTASSSAEIAEGLGKFASVADTVGLSYEYATSALATIVAQTRQSADTVGTGLRTILARLESINLGETLDDGVTLTKYTKALEAVGVQVLDTNGELKKADQILNDVAGVWGSISETQRQSLAYTVGGVRQYTNLVALFDNWDQMQKNISTAMGAEGTVDEQAKIYEESWKAANQRVRASLEEVYAAIINDKFFIDLANKLADTIHFIDTIVDNLGGVPGILLNISSILSNRLAKEVPKLAISIGTNFKNAFGIGRKEGIAFAESLKESLGDDKINLLMTGKQGEKDVSNSGAAEEYAIEARLTRAIELAKVRNTLSDEEYEKQRQQNEILNKQDENLIAITKERDKNLAIIEQEEKLQKELNKQIDEYNKKLNGQNQINNDRVSSTQVKKGNGTKEIKINNLTTNFGSLSDELKNAGASKNKLKEYTDAYEKLLKDVKNKGSITITEYNQRIEELNELYIKAQKTTKEYTKAEQEHEVAIDAVNESRKRKVKAEVDAEAAQDRAKTTYKENVEKTGQMIEHEVSNWERLSYGISTVTSVMTTITSVQAIWNDETTDITQKIGRLLFLLPTLTVTISSVIKMLENANGTTKAISIALTLITSAIGMIASLHKSEAQKLQEELNKTTEAYNKATDALNNFNGLLSGYEDARKGLANLTYGTEEYTNQLNEANKKAKELIETYGLIKNTDYSFNMQGIIEFKADSINEKIIAQNLDVNETEIKNAKNEYRSANSDYFELFKEFQKEFQNVNLQDVLNKELSGQIQDSTWTNALNNASEDVQEKWKELCKSTDNLKAKFDYITNKENLQLLFNNDEVKKEIINSSLDENGLIDWNKVENIANWLSSSTINKNTYFSEEDLVQKLNSLQLDQKGLSEFLSKYGLSEEAAKVKSYNRSSQGGAAAYNNYVKELKDFLIANREDIFSSYSLDESKATNKLDLLNKVGGFTDLTDLLSLSNEDIIKGERVDISGWLSTQSISDLSKLQTMDSSEIYDFLGIDESQVSIDANRLLGLIRQQIQASRKLTTEAINADYEKQVEEKYKNSIDVEEFKNYREILRDINDDLATNAELANETALAHKRLQGGVQALVKDWSNLNDKMLSGNYLDISEALPDINDALKNILNMSDEDFSKLDNDLASKYWEIITKAIQEGDPAALDQLRESYAQELAATFTSPKVMNEITQQMDEFNAKLDEQNYEIGATIDYEGFIEQCNALIAAAGWTAEQAQSYFNAIGITATMVGNKVTSAIANANYSTSTSLDSEALRKQRKVAEKRNKEAAKIFENRDPFHDINISLQRLSKTIEKVNKLQSHLFGADLIKSLEKSNELLIKQDKLYRDKIATAKENANSVKAQLQGYGVDFAGNDIADYNEVLKQFSDALKGKEGEEATAIKERYEEVKSLMDKYENYVNNVIPEMESSLDDNMYQRIANNLQAFEVKINLTLDEESLKREVIDFFNTINENFRETYKLTEEWMNLFDSAENKMSSYSNTIQTDLDKIKTVQDIINNAGYDYTSPNAMFASRSEAVHYLEEASKTLMSDTESVYNLYKQTWEEYLDAIEEVQDQWDEILDGFDQVASQLDHSAKLIELLYSGSDTDTGREQLDQLYKAQEKNSLAKQNILRAELESLEMERKEILAAGADEADKDIRALDEAIQKANEELTNEIESYADTIKLDLENLIRIAKETMDETILGGPVTDVQQEWNDKKVMAEGYYDSVEKVYQIETMESKWEASLAKASTLKSQQLIAAAMERQISALEEKGRLSEKDIELANKELLVLEAQAALEDAQNNKNSMKLVRGADGNWNYQYVADDADIAQKQQDLLDKMNDYRTFAINTSEELTEKYINNYAQFSERMAQIEADTTLSEEERAVKMKELTNTYWGPEGILTGLMEENALFQQAANEATYLELAGLYDKGQENYNRMTDAEKDIVDGFKEHNDNTYTALWDFVNGINDDILNKCIDVNQQSSEAWNDMATNAMDMTRDIQSIVQEAYTEMELAQTQYDNHVTESEKASGITWTNISKAIQNAIVKTETYSDKVQDVIDKTNALSDFANEVNNIGLEWEEVKKLVGENISELRTYLEMLGEASDAIDNLKAKSDEYGGSQTSSVDTGRKGNNNSDGKPQYTKNTGEWEYWQQNIYRRLKANGTYEYQHYSNIGQIDQLSWTPEQSKGSVPTSKNAWDSMSPEEQNKWKKQDIMMQLVAKNFDKWKDDKKNGPFAYVKTQSSFSTFNEEYKNLLRAALLQQYPGYTPSFDTGGYTGSWSGGDGRLAMLHSKELVLNAQDTENLLAAVNTIRGLNDAIEGSIQNRMAGMVAAMNSLTRNSFSGFGSNSETNNNTFNITAEFPNANDVNEIREAILSLPNLASQYLGRNN